MPLTLDPATTDRLAKVYPDLRVRVLRVFNDVYNLHGWTLKVCQGLRLFSDQQAIYQQGRVLVNGIWMPKSPSDIDPVTQKPYSRKGIVTWAQPGDSWHHYSAIDACFAGNDPFLEALSAQDQTEYQHRWSELGRFGKAHGLEWGGDWPEPKKDEPHLQIRYGLTLAQVKELYALGGLRSVWYKFDQIRGVTPGSEWPALFKGLTTA